MMTVIADDASCRLLAWSPYNFAGPLNIKARLHQLLDHHPPEPRDFANCRPRNNSDSIIEAFTTMQYSNIITAAAALFMAGTAVAQNSAQVNLYAHLLVFVRSRNGSKKLMGAAVIMIKNAKIMLATDILALARSLGGPLVLRLSFGWMLVVLIAVMVSLLSF